MAQSTAASTDKPVEISKLYPTIMGKSHVRYCDSLLAELGKGQLSTVFPGYHEGMKKKAAVKFVRNADIRPAKNTKDSVNELEIWREIDQNINIIRLYDSYRDLNYGMFLAMEFADSTFKKTILDSCPPREKIIKWVFQVTNAVEYLHGKGIIHRDIKPDNILMVSQNKTVIAKLADFGVSRMLKNEEISGTKTNAEGTKLYMAPEAQNCQGEKFYNTKKLDIYGLGLVIYFGLSGGKHPFGDVEQEDVPKNMILGLMEPILLVEEQCAVNDLLEIMLKFDPEDRPKIAQVMSNCIFWNWKMEKEFLGQAAIELSGKDSLVDVKKKIDQDYSSYYLKRNGKKFNWMSIAKEEHGIDLQTLLINNPKRKAHPQEYGTGEEVTKSLKLMRDKYQHRKEMQPLAEETFSEGDKIFSEKKYFQILLSCCPDFVGVLYRTLEFYGNNPSLQALSKTFFPWVLERTDKKRKLREIQYEIKPVKNAHTVQMSKDVTRFGNTHSRAFETVEGLKAFSAEIDDDGNIHFTFGGPPKPPKDDSGEN